MPAAVSTQEKIRQFLAAPSYAVVGASNNPRKWSHRCYSCYKEKNLKTYAVNPNETTVLGDPTYPDLLSLPEKVEAVSIITPPPVTEKVIDDAIASGVKFVWMQPGAESFAAVQKAEAAGLTVIHGGACVLVELGWSGFGLD
ncbi:MAG: CoA-binding protein [Candidatus Obscuribacterales bacterium]|jgi:predicted CoA-binding protein